MRVMLGIHPDEFVYLWMKVTLCEGDFVIISWLQLQSSSLTIVWFLKEWRPYIEIDRLNDDLVLYDEYAVILNKEMRHCFVVVVIIGRKANEITFAPVKQLYVGVFKLGCDKTRTWSEVIVSHCNQNTKMSRAIVISNVGSFVKFDSSEIKFGDDEN